MHAEAVMANEELKTQMVEVKRENEELKRELMQANAKLASMEQLKGLIDNQSLPTVPDEKKPPKVNAGKMVLKHNKRVNLEKMFKSIDRRKEGFFENYKAQQLKYIQNLKRE